MEIKIKHTNSFVRVMIIDGQTMIDLGLLNDKERDALAETLIEAVYVLGPPYNNACEKWFADRIKRCGIELPEEEN
jgi:hypothetical protein